MSKKSKIVAGLMVCILAISLMCFGFSQWSSDITLSGSVSAKGNWDVAVTAASMRTSSAASVTYNSADSGEYFVNSFAPKSAMADKVAELEAAGATVVSSEVKTKLQAYISYYDAEGTFHNKEVIGYYDSVEEADSARSERKAEILDAGGTVNSNGRSTVWYYVVTANGGVGGADFTDSTVNYAAVNFSQPGAWAEYSVTITNNGTVAANLADCKVNTSSLNTEVFSVEVPDLTGDVLDVGESCTFTVVVKVIADDSFDTEAQPFSIELVYNAPAVEDAPSASHSVH